MSAEKDFVAGAGSLYIAELDADGLPLGFRYLGDSESFSLSLTTEDLEAWTGDDQVRQKVISVATSVERMGALLLNEPVEENVGLLIFGDAGELEQAATPVTDEAVTSSAVAGLTYSLGVTIANPAGAKDITSVTLDNGDATAYTEGEDYELDPARGTFRVIPGGAMVGETVEANYTPTAGTYQQVTSREDDNPEFFLKYIENARSGRNRDIYCPRVKIRPDGDFDLKSADSHQQIPLQIDALVPTNGMPVMQVIRRDAE